MVYVSRGRELLNSWTILERLGIETGARIADLGCGGSGFFIAFAARLVGDKATVYAVDVSKSALNAVLSKTRLEGITNIKPVWADLEIAGATKIPAGSLDFALLVNTLYESKKPENILEEAKRLLRKGGKLLVVDWSQAPTPFHFGPAKKNRTTEEQVEKIAENLKLKLIDRFQAGPYHYGLIFKK